MIFVDDTNNMDLHFGKAQSLHTFTGKPNIAHITSTTFTYKKETEHLLFCAYHNAADILLLDFFEGLISDFLFFDAAQHHKIFDDTISLTISDQLFCLAAPSIVYPKTINEDFFKFYQNRHAEKVSYNQLRGFIPLIALYTGECVTIKEHQNFIKNLNYKEIQKILNTIHTLN